MYFLQGSSDSRFINNPRLSLVKNLDRFRQKSCNISQLCNKRNNTKILRKKIIYGLFNYLGSWRDYNHSFDNSARCNCSLSFKSSNINIISLKSLKISNNNRRRYHSENRNKKIFIRKGDL